MEQALLNTALGLSIVFCALIFISFCIYLLKYIPQMIELFTGKKEDEAVKASSEKVKDNTIKTEPKVMPEAANKTDDSELIAVISAALAAAISESTGQLVPADGLVIRKIKRRI